VSRTLLAGFDGASMHFDDFEVGDTYRSASRTVTEADVVNFAGLSGDYHALHMDEPYASATPYGRRIAHGMLIVAMSSGLVSRLPVMRLLERTTIGLAGVECRFVKPTFIGDTVHVSVSIESKTPGRKPDRGTLAMRRTVLNQHGEPVVEGVWKLVVRTRLTAA
jgi:acyl dehydratase